MSEKPLTAQEMLKKVGAIEEEIAGVFNIDDFIKGADELLEAKVKGVGTVKFKRLTVEDMLKIRELPQAEQGLNLMFVMLNKADPSITYEKVKALPIKIYNKIFDAVKPLDFL